MSARPGLRTLVALAATLALLAPAAAPPAAAGAARRAKAPVAHAKSKAAGAPASGPAVAEAPDPWHQARSLADAGRYDDALAVLHAALAQQGDDFGLRWLEAGITGEAGRHRESVALYERLAKDHPDQAGELSGDLGAERLWSDDAAGASRDLRRWLQTQPDDPLARRRLALALAQQDSLRPALAIYDTLHAATPGDDDLALERARVLGWMGRHGDAIAAYRAVLARDTSNAAARLGLATNENWAGLHRRATRDLEAIVRDPAADPEALKALAFARDWDADPDGARRAIDGYLQRVPGDAEAQALSRRLAREHGPSLRFEGGRADDSDGLRIVTSGMELRWPAAPGTMGLLRWRRDNLRDGGGTRDPLRLTAGLEQRLGAAWSIHGELTHTDWGDSAGTPVGGELGVVSRPADHVRFEAAVAREPVLTRRSLALGISLLDWIGAVDVMPSDVLTLHVDGRAGFYSDHNGAERTGASARWKVLARRRGELALTLAAEQLHAHSDPSHGYYAPAFHREWGPGADASWQPWEHWTLGATGQAGWQYDRGGNTQPFYTAVGRTSLDLTGAWTLEAEGGRSDSSLQNEAGYRRNWWQAALVVSF